MTAPRPGDPCRLCGAPSCTVVALSHGCICYPDDRVQALCCHHAERITPLGSIDMVADAHVTSR